MAMLGLIHFYIWHQGIQWEIIKEFGSSALYIIQGEYYRAVTALFLHSDIEHLTGNLLGLFVFGTGVFSLTGYGKGSLMLLLSGFSGNITTAYFKRTLYFSIGASTTILGAAGILTALEIARQKKTSVSGIRLFAPFAAGMALLGFLSNGKNTDISAHLFGFLWGFLIGGIYIVLFNEKQNTKSENILYSIISIIIVFGAFMKKF
jgi:membrane associated rhomboid family serine protease